MTTTQSSENVALFDMDGTLADYDQQMQKDFDELRSPHDPPHTYRDDDHPWVAARVRLIRNQPGWWRNLPRLELGFRLLHLACEIGFEPHILTKGPSSSSAAWSEKVDWSRDYVRGAKITLTEDKGSVYGRILVDDWLPHCLRWREWRPRGLIIVPAHPWNEIMPDDPNMIRTDGTNLDEVAAAMRARYVPPAK